MRILDPAPRWTGSRSSSVILWHGCLSKHRDGIEQKGINLQVCRASADFGRGFYTTTLRLQAEIWAWKLVKALGVNDRRLKGNRPVVLRFHLSRVNLGELLSLHFTLGGRDNDDYWSLVQHCRRSTPSALRDHHVPGLGWYDVVTGPVAAFWEDRVAMQGADQISFHSSRAVKLLNGLIKGSLGQKSREYRWLRAREPIERR